MPDPPFHVPAQKPNPADYQYKPYCFESSVEIMQFFGMDAVVNYPSLLMDPPTEHHEIQAFFKKYHADIAAAAAAAASQQQQPPKRRRKRRTELKKNHPAADDHSQQHPKRNRKTITQLPPEVCGKFQNMGDSTTINSNTKLTTVL